MKMTRWTTRLLGVVAACLPQVTGALQCVEYGSVSLVGTLVRQTYAGPPDFESVTKGDEPQVIWILQLDERTCVYSQSREAREYEQHEVQLQWNGKQPTNYLKLLGKRLVIDGALIRGGAQHDKRLVLIVSQVREAAALQDRKNSYRADCRCYERL
jgi:hypothetical protein